MPESTKATDRDIAVPDVAEFFREMDGGGRLTPVAADEAQRGDIVVLRDRRAGIYLGDGRMLLEGGEWADFLRLLPTLVVHLVDAPADSMDPLELYKRPEIRAAIADVVANVELLNESSS